MSIQSRKKDHIDIMLSQDVNSRLQAGFEDILFLPKSLPELDYEQVKTETEFLGKTLQAPILLSSMTGGTEEATAINKNLATMAEKFGLAISVGSQKAMIRYPELSSTYEIRRYAPNVLLIGNVGIDYLLNDEYSFQSLREALEKIGADALFVHLNVLQELVQPEGNRKFTGVYEKIREVTQSLGLPVMVKEVGCGIDLETAKKLEECGIRVIDVAGVGGTSWAAVEGHRGSELGEIFRDWGIQTALNLLILKDQLNVPIIASGGLKNGLDIAKSFVLGADLAGIAGQIFKKAVESPEALEDELEKIIIELKTAMLLVGAKSISQLKEAKLLFKGTLKELKEQI